MVRQVHQWTSSSLTSGDNASRVVCRICVSQTLSFDPTAFVEAELLSGFASTGRLTICWCTGGGEAKKPRRHH